MSPAGPLHPAPRLQWLAARRHALPLGVLALSLAVVACGRTYYTPDVVGVVSAKEPLPDGRIHLSLEDGRSVTVDPHVQRIILGSGTPDAGELYLAGSEPKPWVARLAWRDPCFWIGGSGSEDGEFIATDAGLRLPKAGKFDRGEWHESEHEFHGGGFCVNAAGEVTAIQ